MGKGVASIKGIAGWAYQLLGSAGDQIAYKRGVDFSNWVSQEEAGFNNKRGNQYQPSSIPPLKRALARYHIQGQDVLIDIGCGKGKVMSFCARRYPFSAVRGLELSPRLAETARKNFDLLGLKQCEVICGDAMTFTDYDSCNFLYMFNPFPEDVFKAALKNISESLRRCPRKCVLIYMNPVYHQMIEDETPFRLKHTVKAITSWFSCNCYEYDP